MTARSLVRGAAGLPSRLLRFVVGLALCAAGVWLSVEAGLGLSPWDVLHAGLSHQLGLSFGTVVVALGLALLAVAGALGVRPGVGTVFNVVAVGVTIDHLLSTRWLDNLAATSDPTRLLVLLVAVTLLGFGAALYIGAGFGSGPRDSLMIACHRRGLPIGPSRFAIEVVALLVGWSLGGAVGLGTFVIALGTGPAIQTSFRLLRQEPPGPPPRPASR